MKERDHHVRNRTRTDTISREFAITYINADRIENTRAIIWMYVARVNHAVSEDSNDAIRKPTINATRSQV